MWLLLVALVVGSTLGQECQESNPRNPVVGVSVSLSLDQIDPKSR